MVARMERFDVSEGERLSDMVARAERGEPVEITRDGRVVARVTGASGTAPKPALSIEKLRALRARVPAGMKVEDAAALIREMRDMDEH